MLCTYPIGFAHGLKVNAVALDGREGGVPEAIVGLVVTHGEGLHHSQAGGKQLGGKVVRRVEDSGVPETDGHREAFAHVHCPPRLLLTLLLHYQLIGAAERENRLSLSRTSPKNSSFLF